MHCTLHHDFYITIQASPSFHLIIIIIINNQIFYNIISTHIHTYDRISQLLSILRTSLKMYTPITFLSIALGITSAAPVAEDTTVIANKGASAVAVTSSATAVCTPSAAPDPAIYAKLASAPTAVQRESLLTDSDYIFDFDDPCRVTGEAVGKGGRTVRADRATMPALYAQGASVTIGFLGPCGFNTPHVHPRSSQINIVVEGRLGTDFIAENGVPPINGTLKKLQMTVFPQGAVHTEVSIPFRLYSLSARCTDIQIH